MTFLKKLGTVLAKVAGIVLGFTPAIEAALPQATGPLTIASSDLQQILQIIATVEAIGGIQGMTGPQKLAAATPLVAQVVLQSAALAGKPIADQMLFMKGVGEITQGVVDVFNAAHPSGVVVGTIPSGPSGTATPATPATTTTT